MFINRVIGANGDIKKFGNVAGFGSKLNYSRFRPIWALFGLGWAKTCMDRLCQAVFSFDPNPLMLYSHNNLFSQASKNPLSRSHILSQVNLIFLDDFRSKLWNRLKVTLTNCDDLIFHHKSSCLYHYLLCRILRLQKTLRDGAPGNTVTSSRAKYGDDMGPKNRIDGTGRQMASHHDR